MKRMNKMIKKVFAIGMGTALLGSTIIGAAAVSQDLSKYPVPFVKDGVFDTASSAIVIGERAETSDVLGAIEIAASLQASSVSVRPTGLGFSTDPTISKGVKISKSSNELNYGESVHDIDSKFNAGDMPLILSDGTYDENEGQNDNEERYKQTLEFSPGTATLLYEQDSNTDITGTYLKFVEDVPLYKYTLSFDDWVKYTNTSGQMNRDFEGSKIDIQGTTYTITQAEMASSGSQRGKLSKLKFLVGDVVRWLSQDAPVNIGDSTVTVISVDERGGKCGVEVDGEVRWLSVGETRKIGGLNVGLLDAIAVHSRALDQDTCELTLGSQELLLEHGKKVKMNGKEVQGSNVRFLGEEGGRWDGLEITWTPEKDDIYLSAGEQWTDPVFGNWKIAFEGITNKVEREEIKVASDSKKGRIEFKNIEGDKTVIPFIENRAQTVIGWGDDEDDFGKISRTGTQTNNSMAYVNGEYCDADTFGGSDVTDCEGISVLAVSDADEARLFRLQRIDESKNEITFRDSANGKNYVERYTEGVASMIDIGITDITVTVDESGKRVTFNMIDSGEIQTSLGAVIALNDYDEIPGGLRVNVTEDRGRRSKGGTSLSFDIRQSGRDVVIDDVTGVSLSEEHEDSDEYIGATAFGSVVRYDEDNKDSLVITYPEEQVHANAFIAPISAEVISGAESGTLSSEKVNRIPVGMSVLDRDALSMSKNMIVVGGPCVNAIADEVTGSKEYCTDGFETGKARIAYYDRRGKVALLVAGMTAQDTLAASYVLANHKDYPELKGDAVELAVASLSEVIFTN